MTRALVVVLALALPAAAQQPLTPSPELAQKLEALEAKRGPIEARRSRVAALRLSAATGYVLALSALAWAIAELIAYGARRAEPLTGLPYRMVVPTVPMVAAALGLAGVGVTLHIAARMQSDTADHEEEDLADEERDLRSRYGPRSEE